MPSTEIKFGVIGCGRFGKLWTQTLSAFGSVAVFDKNPIDPASLVVPAGQTIQFLPLEQVATASMIFLCVPISEIDPVCRELAPLLSPGTIVVDTCSVKVYPAKVMQAILPKNQPLIATHPLFGPDSVARLGTPGRKIVVCPLRVSTVEQDQLLSILKELQLHIIETTADNHDRQMARSQSLVHLLGRVFADLDLNNQEISTPDYESLLRINSFVNNDTWQLFFDMQCYNPYTPLMRLTLRQSLDNLEEKIRVESETKAPDDGTFFLWRSMIEQLDHEIIQLIAHRLNVGKRVQEYKKMRDLPVTDPEREKELDKNYEIWMRELGISAVEPVKNVLKLLMKEVKSQNQK